MTKDNYAVVRKLQSVAALMKALPTKMADFYANGGAGVGQGVVGDRFQGAGNARFEALKEGYAKWKGRHAGDLNKSQRKNYQRGSKLINVPYKTESGNVVKNDGSTNLPILVLTGATRAAVTSRKTTITQEGDVAYCRFHVPDYAKWLQRGTKKMPKRSPVDPNEEDMERVTEFAKRQVKAYIGSGKAITTFGGGTPRVIL